MTKLAQQFVIVAAFMIVAATSPVLLADIIWDYESTDGIDTLSGQLITSGSLPLAAGTDYTLISETSGFNLSPVGGLVYDGLTASVGCCGQPDMMSVLEDPISGPDGFITIGRVGGQNSQLFLFGGFLEDFEPTSNTFTPVAEVPEIPEIPEPSSIVLVTLALLGLLAHGRRRRT